MIAPLRSAIFVALGSYVASPADPLRVMRAAPTNEAEAGAVVTVVFDRPIAAGLDATVDPAAIFRIAPRVAGKLEWRDPVTIRFTPSAPLAFGTTYSVTIANTFQAMDGSRLEQPYAFSFRVRGPRVEDAWPVNRWSEPKHLTPTTKFFLLLDGPADPKSVASLVEIRAPACGRPEIGLTVLTVRRIKRDDPRWTWYRRPDSSERHRVAELVAERPLPTACAAELGVPERIDSVTATRWWKFKTYGPLAVEWSGCWYWRDDSRQRCPVGPPALRLSTPVRGAEVLRRVRLAPPLPFTVRDTSEESDTWTLEAELEPQTRYSIAVDAGLTDVFGQRLAAPYAQSFMTTSYTPTVRYPHGRMVVERIGTRTLAVQHVNVDTLELLVAGVPDSLEGQALAQSWGWEDLWSRLLPAAERRNVPVTAPRDAPRVTGVRLPVYNAARPGSPTLLAVKVRSNQADPNDRWQPVALLQVTDLAIQARIGAGEGAVWVTGVGDGQPRTGATVTLHDRGGRVRARATTDARGLARLAGFAADTAAGEGDEEGEWEGDFQEFEGYVAATLASDRALVGVSRYDPDLSPWQFNVRAGWGDERRPEAAAVFTERGIYRPGEPVYAKAIVRRGLLGALRPPPRGDSLRWVFSDRENGTLKDTTVTLSAFGTADQTLALGPDLPLGQYRVRIEGKRDGQWRALAATWYRVAEYRPPEFQVTATRDSAPRFAGDSVTVDVEARYLFGAPMGRARVSWVARTSPAWWVSIPGADDYYLGETGWWWEDDDGSGSGGARVYESGQDTLDAGGRLRLTVPVAPPVKGRAASTTVEATVTDVNRQTVSAAASALVHPAAFYVGAKVAGNEYFWVAGKPRTVNLIAVTPEGRKVPGVAIRGSLVHREWHRVRRERGGYSEEVGEWVSDTVGRCAVVSATEPVSCTFTPQAGGQYVVGFAATDPRGRLAATSFWRWASGKDWVPWSDESKFKMDVIPDKTRYTVGDTATILLASPFTDAEAWVTVEREGLMEQRRLRLTSGSTTLKLPITEAHVPNAFVSIIVVRGRSAPPGPPDDPGRPTLRVGYAELRVTPEVKRLAVEVRPAQTEYRPGDSARVRLQVRDARGQGRRAEVTLWAVDEGVLSLTGYKTPDPLDLLYRPRGLGLRLASNLVSVAPQVRDSASVDKGQEPGSGGGMDVEGILRSRFQTTAFFLGSVVTDSGGRAVAAAKLPDNLTTFRVMAVAVTTGDRYGSGQSPLLVTRPLLARPALPRFVREDDQYAAGVVVNHRLGGTPTVKVEAWSRGVTLVDPPTRDVVL
ncbi:MAG: Ig-like domain-containing protein, partial [Gemmatimonadales bacterium]